MSVDLSKYLNMYKFFTVLPGSGKKVNFKPITTFQMKELLAYSGEDPEEALDNLVNSCVIDEGFEVRDLSLQDRFFMVVELRKRSKGSDYDISYVCGKCGGQVIAKVDLNELEVKKLGKLNDKVKLDDNISVKLKLMTRNTQLEAGRIVKEKEDPKAVTDEQKYMEEVIMGYILSIKEIILPDAVIENPSLDEKLILFQQGPEYFYDKIIKWYGDLNFGVDFTLANKCPHCADEIKMNIPLANFFG